MKVKELMNPVSHKVKKKEINVNPEENIDNAALLMREHDLKEIQVVEDEKVIGLITRKVIVESSDDLNENFFLN